MKLKKILRKPTYLLQFLSLIIILFLVGCRNTINLPNTDDVVRIEMGSISITNNDEIEIIMSAISSATRRNRNANDDRPFGNNVMNIYLYMVFDDEAEMSHRLYLYTDDAGIESLWNSYVGIYSLSQENTNMLRQFYEELLENQN